MAVKIPDKYLDLFQQRAFGFLATLNADGSPQVTPVWVDYDGTYVLVNSAQGRRKDQNMRARPRVAVAIVDQDNPYRYIQVRGRVTEITEEGAHAHIDKLAHKYRGVERYDLPPGQIRVLYKIEPEVVTTNG